MIRLTGGPCRASHKCGRQIRSEQNKGWLYFWPDPGDSWTMLISSLSLLPPSSPTNSRWMVSPGTVEILSIPVAANFGSNIFWNVELSDGRKRGPSGGSWRGLSQGGAVDMERIRRVFSGFSPLKTRRSLRASSLMDSSNGIEHSSWSLSV